MTFVVPLSPVVVEAMLSIRELTVSSKLCKYDSRSDSLGRLN